MSDTFKTIVIGTSLSAMSDDIVRAGADIAEATGAVPWLIHVHSRPGSSAEMFGAVDGKWMAEYEETLRDRLADQAQRTGLTPAGIRTPPAPRSWAPPMARSPSWPGGRRRTSSSSEARRAAPCTGSFSARPPTG